MLFTDKSTVIHKNGSILVDAAICVPLFIIAIAMLLQVINFAGIEERKYYDAFAMISKIGLAESNADLGKSVRDNSRFISIDHVQSIPIMYKIDFPFSGAFFKNDLAIMDMPFRTYIGESPDIYNSDYVYIFPKNEGSEKTSPKYHTTYCRTIKGGITRGLEISRVLRKDAINRHYSLCEWCAKEESKK